MSFDSSVTCNSSTIDEIQENEFNLNIPRYVDTFEEEPPVDIKKVSQELQDINKKIKACAAVLLRLEGITAV